MLGQITQFSDFGRAIQDVCSRPEVNTCVDIGSWNGLGSTQCIVQVLTSKGSGHVYSYEIDDHMFEQSQNVWKNNPYITLQKARVTETMMTHEDVVNDRNYSNIAHDDWLSWYTGEQANFEKSVVGTLPEKIDFVIIDGGEFCGRGDWAAVQTKDPEYVALDDTFTVKTGEVLHSMLESGEWVVLYQGIDRNGWAILRKDRFTAVDEVGVSESSETDSGE
jgi:hypothetical protein